MNVHMPLIDAHIVKMTQTFKIDTTLSVVAASRPSSIHRSVPHSRKRWPQREPDASKHPNSKSGLLHRRLTRFGAQRGASGSLRPCSTAVKTAAMSI